VCVCVCVREGVCVHVSDLFTHAVSKHLRGKTDRHGFALKACLWTEAIRLQLEASGRGAEDFVLAASGQSAGAR